MTKLDFDPFPIIETERLSLIKIESCHKDELYAVLSDPKVAQYDYFYPVTSLDQVESFIERYTEEIASNSEITWGICVKATDMLIGTCCLGNFDEKSQRSEVGYAIRQSEWHKGYATEAVNAIIRYGFETMQLNRIEATITPGNEASVRVLEKLSFQKEGHVRQRDYIKGELVDGIIMGLLKTDL